MIVKTIEDFAGYVREKIEYNKALALIFFIGASVASAVIVMYGEVFKHAEQLCRSLLNEYPFGIFGLSPIVFIASFLLVQKIAPLSSGSGIPQVMVAAELHANEKTTPFLRELLSLKTAIIKILSSLLGVLGGGAIGREGPSLHISTGFFYLFYRIFNKIHRNIDHTLWVITGAAAGLAAAFNTPLGGIVYAIEELGARHFSKIRTHLLISILISGLISQTLLGGYLYIGTPKTNPFNYKLIIFVVICSYILGLLGGFFGQFLFVAMNWRRKFKSSWAQWALIFILSEIIACIIFFDHESLGSGKEYINHLLFNPENMQIYTPFLRITNTLVSYITGIAGGIFAPSLAIGAGFGYYLGELYSQLTGIDNMNILILCGMISFLTSVTRTPFTSFILVLEMTDRHAAIVPMMTSALVSYYAAYSLYNEGFYELTRDYIFKHQAPQENPTE
ncbi:MAG: chloride channel protein [Pseudobdellovibrionaceae bacterium]